MVIRGKFPGEIKGTCPVIYLFPISPFGLPAKVEIADFQYLVANFLYQGSLLPVPVSRLPVPDSLLSVSGSRLPVPGSILPVPGSRLPVSGSLLPVPGSRLPLPNI